MSWQAIKHVYETASDDHTPHVRAVAVYLAWHANPVGAEAYPAQASIAAATKVSIRKVGAALTQLEAEGLIECYRRLPNGGGKVYRFPGLKAQPDPATGDEAPW